MNPLQFLDDEIASLKSASRLRVRHAMAPSDAISACSNDYLGYGSQRLQSGACLGATGSRLVVGDSPEHVTLEHELAAWTRQRAALLFTSGYAANLGVVTALAGAGDLVVSLSLNHASIIDGCRLSGARVRVVPVLDTEAARQALLGEGRRKFLVTESYFSMDGIEADLRGLRRACDEAGAAMIVDEAHALGVFGREGAGLCEREGVRPDLLVGTLGKAIGGQGAFVAGSDEAVLWLWNRARPFVYSTGISPELCIGLRRNVARARADDAARARLHGNTQRLRSLLLGYGVPVLAGSVGPIVPVVVGSSEGALRVQDALKEAGFVVRAIRPPTVPEGMARLRVTVNAGMTEGLIESLAEALRSTRCCG